jgi:hypothetical protein
MLILTYVIPPREGLVISDDLVAILVDKMLQVYGIHKEFSTPVRYSPRTCGGSGLDRRKVGTVELAGEPEPSLMLAYEGVNQMFCIQLGLILEPRTSVPCVKEIHSHDSQLTNSPTPYTLECELDSLGGCSSG